MTGATSSLFNIAPGAATQLQFSVQPANTIAGQSISPNVVVRILDAAGNVVDSNTSFVSLVIGTNPGGGTLSGATTVQAVAGVATFTNLSINKSGVGYTLSAVDGALTGATSRVQHHTGGATHLQFSTQPTSAIAGAAISPAVTVQVLDAFDNLVQTAISVTVGIGANPGGGTLGGTTTVAAVNGVATFNDLFIDKAATGYTLAASSTGLTSGTSATFNISAAATTNLAFGVQPSTVAAGQFISPAVQVFIQDAFGNVDATANTPVTIAIAANPGGATLGGTLTVTAVNGVATFSDLTLDKAAINYTLTAFDGVLVTAISAPFNVVAGAATHLAISTQPSDTQAGQAISPAVQVRVLDFFDNLVTTNTSFVTVSLNTNPGGSVLSGSLSVQAAGGVATFSNLSLNKAATGYSLAFVMVRCLVRLRVCSRPGSADHLAFIQQPTNTIAGQSIARRWLCGWWTHRQSSPTATTSRSRSALAAEPSAVRRPAVGGVATFSDLSINKAGIGYTLTATTSSVTNGTSASFNIVGRHASGFRQQPTTTVAGQFISPLLAFRYSINSTTSF